MNDYQMNALSHDRMAALHAEAQRSRLAHDAEAGQGRGWLRRVIAAAFHLIPDLGERDDEEWSNSPHRRDAWSSSRIAR